MIEQDTHNVGKILRETRLSKDISIEDASDQVKIRAKYIRALEEGTAEDIPARAYARGYLRSYSEFLGLNPDDLLQSFEIHYDLPHGYNLNSLTLQVASRMSAPTPIVLNRPKWIIALASLIITLGILIAWSYYDSNLDNRGIQHSLGLITDESVSPPDEEHTPPLTYEATSSYNQTIGTDVVNPLKQVLSTTPYALLARGKTWVKIFKNTQELLLEKNLTEGDTLFLPQQEGLQIKAQNPHLLDILNEKGEMKPFKQNASYHMLDLPPQVM